MADARVDAKVVLIGDAAVGKTSLVVRFLHDRFDTTLPTVGASYATKQVTLPSGRPFALGIWDTAGQERFDALSSFYCRDARAAVVCFDLTDRASFDSLKERWLDKVANEAEKNCILCLVGTKSDLVGTDFLRAVSRDEVAAFAKARGAHTFECSARDNTCVDTTGGGTTAGLDAIFQHIASGLGARLTRHTQDDDGTVRVGATRKEGGCCG